MSNSQKFNGYSSGGGGVVVVGETPRARGLLAHGAITEGGAVGHTGNSESTRKTFPTLNPFIHNLQLTTLQKVQIAIMTVTLVPIRLVLVGICLLFGWFFACLSLIGRSKEDEMKPMTGWRRAVRPLAVFFSRAMFFVAGFHWVSVKGKRATSAEAPILAAAPHSSYLDALPVTYLGLTSVVAKTEAKSVPFFGTLTKFTQPVLVSREDASSRQSTIREIQRRAAARGEWPQIIIFTEGTCTNRSCLINFKPGAFIPGVPVQPVCLRYSNRLDTITWTWKGPKAFSILWLTLCQFHSSLEIEFLPVYVPGEEEKRDVKLFGRNVRAQMARALGVPTTENSFEDGQAMLNAENLNLPIAEDLVHINRIVRQSGIPANVLKERLPDLCAAAQLSATSLMLDEFAARLESPPTSPHLKELFMFYQNASENVVDLRKYVIVFSLLSLPPFIDDFLQFCFKVYDRNQKGFLVAAELYDLLKALGLPLSVVDLLANCSNEPNNGDGPTSGDGPTGGDGPTSGDRPTVQISYEIFKAAAKELQEYDGLFGAEYSADKNRKNEAASSEKAKRE